MGKPLLTDDMIERSNRGEKVSGQTILDQETKIISTEDPHSIRNQQFD